MIRFSLILATFFLFSGAVRAQPITIWAEIYTPLSYSDNGKISGFSTEIVEHLIEDSEVKVKDWHLASWARAYDVVKTTPDTLLYTVVRKADREDLFHWVGPISDRKIFLFKMKKSRHVQVSSNKDAANYLVGGLRDAAANESLLSAGVTLDEANSPEVQFLKLVNGRNELSIFLDFTLYHLAAKHGYSADDFEPVLLLDDTKKYYITLNRDSSPDSVQALKTSFQKIKENGVLDSIKSKYMPSTR